MNRLPLALLGIVFSPLLLPLCAQEPAPASPPQNRPAPTEYFVSPDGKAENPGTREKPFASVERARDEIRDLKKKGILPAAGVTVWIRGGTYPFSRTLEFSEKDSGSEGAPIIYASAPGEKPRFFGGTPLDPSWFKPVTDAKVLDRVISVEARKKLLECPLSAHGITEYGRFGRRGYGDFKKQGLYQTPPVFLYQGEKRLMLARWPNPMEHYPELLNRYDTHRRGVVSRKSIIDPGPSMSSPEGATRGGVFEYAIDRPSLWTQAEDLWLDGIFSWSWEWSYNKVNRIDPVKKQITLQYGEASTIKDVYSGNWFFAENLLEEIDLPGEYYIDRAKGVLYLLPPLGFKGGDPLYLSTLEGTMIQAKSAHDLTFRGLSLDTGRGSAMQISNAKRIRVEGCEIARFSLDGVNLSGNDCVLAQNHIHDVGGNAMSLYGGDLKTLTPSNNLVTGCTLHDWGWYNRVYTAGASLYGVGHHLTRCDIYNSPHGGILVGGNDHLIDYNDIHDVCREFIDLGAIYINVGGAPFERGWVIRGNYFHDIGNSEDSPINVEGVYIDHGSSGGLIEQNYFNRIGIERKGLPPACAVWLSGLNGIVRHNVFIRCTEALAVGAKPKPDAYLEERYRLYPWEKYFSGFDLTKAPHLEKYPETKALIPNGRKFTEEDMWNEFHSNVIFTQTKVEKIAEVIKINDEKKNPVVPLREKGNVIIQKDPGPLSRLSADFQNKWKALLSQQIPDFPVVPLDQIGVPKKEKTDAKKTKEELK